MNMKVISDIGDMMATASRHGVPIGRAEAYIMLDILNDRDFELYVNNDFKMWLHDRQDGESRDHDTEYTMRDVVELCSEINEEYMLETSDDKEKYFSLLKDEHILYELSKRCEKVIPPTVREHKVIIIEHLKKVVSIEAASWEEAESIAKERWKNGDYILDADDFAGVMFSYGG